MKIECLENRDVWRDDLLDGGTKSRFLKPYIQRRLDKYDEFIYCSPRVGYGQLSLSIVCNELGCKSTIFVPKGNTTPITQKCIELGSNVIQVPMGYLSNLHHKSKRYNEENINSHLLPFGFDCDEIIQDGVDVLNSLHNWKDYDEVWSVISSGVLSRILQGVFPKSRIIGVRIGHNTTERERGRAETFLSKYKFNQECKEPERPPFPSSLTYDSKAWEFIKEHASEGALFWNVGK